MLGVPPPAAPRDLTLSSSSLAPPLAVERTFRPYYSPLQLDHLVHLQATQRPSHDEPLPGTAGEGQQEAGVGGGAAAALEHRNVMSDARIEAYRQLACGFIERVGGRLGFPRRTIATAQKLYHRFHLHFPLTDFVHQDVSLSALLVASKLEDTLKKLRDIQIAGWQMLNMMDGGDGRGEGDLSSQEAHRPHLIGIERVILQTISFNFNLHRSLSPPASSLSSSSADGSFTLSAAQLLALATPPPTRDAFTYLLRLASSLPSLPVLPPSSSPPTTPEAQESLRKSLTFLSFLLLSDLHRTLAPLSYPPHTCAAACIWTAGFLLVEAATPAGEKGGEGEGGEGWDEEMRRSWARETESEDEDIDDIAQTLLTLLISLCPSPPSLSSSSSTALHGGAQPSPLFSPASASPSDSSALPSSSTAAAAGAGGQGKVLLSERDKHLMAAGVPNAFSHPAALPSSSSSTGGGGGFLSPDRLTAVKIRLRCSRPSPSSSLKRPSPSLNPSSASTPDADAQVLKRARRWSALSAGLSDIARLRDERDERDLVRLLEREEREREKLEAEEAAAEGGGGSGRTSRNKTMEEREQERRERRERGKPGSVRYRFA
ncbi:hypothetical protein JCM8547_003224 [Rhodosporidiobolus lusitaniae]